MRYVLLLLAAGVLSGEYAPLQRHLATRAVAPGSIQRSTGARGIGASLAVHPAGRSQARAEGVALTVDGRPRREVGLLESPQRIVVDNGRFRLTWYVGLCEPAAFEADVKVGGVWVDATAHCVGDWLYPGGPVQSKPTAIEVLRVDSGEVALRLRFGDHWIRPRQVGYPSWYVDQRYPFYRTVWLRRGEYGYFTEIVIEKKPIFPYPDIEHEVGFGGLWGPARIRTSQSEYRTDTMSGSVWTNFARRPDAAEFVRDGDRVFRVLVPLGGAPMISPVFSSSFGGVYVYSMGPTTKYGAYLYVAPTPEAETARRICQFAWRSAPFALPPVSRQTLENCGPGTVPAPPTR